MRLITLVMLFVVAAAALGAQGFDFETVRADFFAGASGDAAALQRTLDATGRALSSDPKNAQALVVHGFTTVLAGGEAFQAGDAARGSELFQRGLGDVDEAVALAPRDPLVRALRGILLQQATRQMPPALQTPLLENARDDFQFLFDIQAALLDDLGEHRLGELLQGLGDVHSRLGRIADAERFYTLIREKLPNTEYAARAGEWLATKQPLPAARTVCIGCHVATR